MIRLIFIFTFFYTYCFADETVLINYPQNSDIIILNPGDYKVGEFDITLKDKEWFAVYENSNFSSIKKVKLKIEKIEPDIQYDWEYRVSVEDNKDCLFLISGLDLTDRKFDYYANNDILKNNQDFTFEFGPYHTYISSKIKLKESFKKSLFYKTGKVALNSRIKKSYNKVKSFSDFGITKKNFVITLSSGAGNVSILFNEKNDFNSKLIIKIQLISYFD